MSFTRIFCYAALILLACFSSLTESKRVHVYQRPTVMCRRADSAMGSSFSKNGWIKEDGMVKWSLKNNYNASKTGAGTQLCYSFDVSSGGKYRLLIEGKRKSMGRKGINCNHSNKAKSLRDCPGKCVCNDEENDVWSLVSGQHAVLGDKKAMTPLKAMVDCPWNQTCTRYKVNVDHKMFDADYWLAAGTQYVCIRGRSERTMVKEICLEKQ